MAGSEDFVSADTQRRHGTLLMVLASASVFVWVLLSDGYDPRLGAPASFYYTMNIHHSEWFCKTSKPPFRIPGAAPMKEGCSEVTLYTKHAVLLSFITGVYGLLIRMVLVSDPFPWCREIGVIAIAGIVRSIKGRTAIGTSTAQSVSIASKIKVTIDSLAENLDVKKFADSDKKYAQYYCAYLDGVARAICSKEGAEYNDANRYLVYHEAQRLLGSGRFDDDSSLTRSKMILLEALSSEAGRRGREEGRKDGAYAVEITNPGPYFNRARAYFGLPPAEVAST